MWKVGLKADVKPSWHKSFHFLSGNGKFCTEVTLTIAAQCYTGNGVKQANAVNNVMIECTTAVWSCDGVHPPPSLPSQSSEALPAREAETRHEEMELEIVIIDKHFPYDLVCPASRKLQGCCSKLGTEATDFICL